jgi:hypothetical protein
MVVLVVYQISVNKRYRRYIFKKESKVVTSMTKVQFSIKKSTFVFSNFKAIYFEGDNSYYGYLIDSLI